MAAQAVLAQLGVHNASIDVTSGGQSVTIGIPTASVCGLPPNATTLIVSDVKSVGSWVQSVAVVVAGSQQTLSSYTSASCRPTQPPTGGGKLIYEKSGQGNLSTAVFTVTTKSWTVSFVNYGGFFAYEVEKNGKTSRDYDFRTSPGSGSKTFDDGPGRFRLEVSGATWKVQVYGGS
jgi:hypothetical protein